MRLTIFGMPVDKIKAIWKRLYSKAEYEKLCDMWEVEP